MLNTYQTGSATVVVLKARCNLVPELFQTQITRVWMAHPVRAFQLTGPAIKTVNESHLNITKVHISVVMDPQC